MTQSVKELEQLIASLTCTHKEHLLELDDTLAKLAELQSLAYEQRRRKQDEIIAIEQAKAALAEAKFAEAEAAYAKGLAPDLDNPELQKLIATLESWEHYSRLDDYQVEDIVFTLDRWLRTKDQEPSNTNVFTRGVINANDTGMGKTLETIAFLWVMRQANPNARIIWFTAKPLVKETSPEASMKWGFSMIPVLGTTPEKVNMIKVMLAMPFAPCLAINYEAVNNEEILTALGTNWDFMVIDEVHKLRGGANYRPTQIWSNTLKFKQQSNAWPLMLSGSIINNFAVELWAPLHIMDELRFPDKREFELTMKAGAVAKSELLKILAPSMFRRTKAEVNIKLPERIVKHHYLTLSDPVRTKIYRDFESKFMAWLENQDGEAVRVSFKSILDQLIRLRACLVYPETMRIKHNTVDPDSGEVTTTEQVLSLGNPEKLDYAAELANNLIMEGQQVVICSAAFNAPLNYIATKLVASSEKLYGENSQFGGEISERFRQGQTRVILTNLKSGAVGFNWQTSDDWPGGAEHLIMIDDWYNPELVKQMWDRVWRRGAKRRVIIHVLQFEDTIDQVVEAIREGKMSANAKITESTVLRAGDWAAILKSKLRSSK